MRNRDRVQASHDPSRLNGVAAVPQFGRRLPRGQSDPIGPTVGGSGGGYSSIGCGCDPAEGAIVLFYAYTTLSDPKGVVARLQRVCEDAGVTGKLRVAAEGINGTAAGTIAGIRSLVTAMREDPDAALAAAAAAMDFKPAPGCAHLFDAVSVRLVPEIVPFDAGQLCTLGGQRVRQQQGGPQRTWRPHQEDGGGGGGGASGGGGGVASGDGKEAEAAGAAADDVPGVPVGYVDPLEFHRIVETAKRERAAAAAAAAAGTSLPEGGRSTVVLDVRNWYESRVGHFDGAVLAPLRRFSQFPEYVAQHGATFEGKDVLVYCTGGIRCEKAARFLACVAPGGAAGGGGRPASVRQLRGGIVAYARDVLGQCRSAGEVDVTRVEKKGEENDRLQGGDDGGDADGGGGGGGDENMTDNKASSSSSPPSPPLLSSSSMYRGCNFVFDKRGAVRVTDEVTSWCDGCGAPCDRMGKCASEGCHCILVVCEACDGVRRTAGNPGKADSLRGGGGGEGSGGGGGGVFCCGPCKGQDDERAVLVSAGQGKKRRRPCDCDSYAARARRLFPHPPPHPP